MAVQPKKKKSSTSKKKKVTIKKTTVRRKTTKKRKKKSSLKRDIFIVLGLCFVFALVLAAYFLGKNESIHSKSVQGNKTIHSKLKKDVNKKQEKKEVKKLKSTQKKRDNKTVHKPAIKVAYPNKKPKLVIIIDDVHTRVQVEAIKKLGMKITPSIFPPYKLSPQSHVLAKNLDHYMIHLPMESGNVQFNTQYKTLKISFSNKQIKDRIKELRQLFPKAKFINNHTGSVFTSDYASMRLAYKIMKENGFFFLDSKTIKTTKVKKIAEANGDVYIARDIFIDNIHTVKAIHIQLKKAVQMAKKKGYAIAIGHPHHTTMQALASAKSIFKDVELIYIDGLYH